MTSQTPYSSAPTLSHYVDVLVRRKATFVLGFAAVLALVTPFVYGLPSLYRASTTVLVEGQVPEGFTQTGTDGELDNRLQAIKQEALSRARLTDLLERFDLYPHLRGRVPTEILLSQIQRDIKFEFTSSEQSSRPTTVAFKITYTGRDPDTVAGVANRLASFYVEKNDTLRTRQATRATELLKQSLTDTRKRLDTQAARMQDFLNRNVGRLPQQMDANLLALTRLNGQIQFNAEQQNQLMERRQELQKAIGDLDMNAASATATATSDPVVKLNAAKRELVDLQTRFSDTYPDVVEKKREIAQLEREVQNLNGRTSEATTAMQKQRAMLTRNLQEVESKLDELSNESKSLRSQTQGYLGRVESAPVRGPEYEALTKDYAATRDVYDQLYKKYDDARLNENLEHTRTGEEFRVLDAALPPPYPAGPNRFRLLVVGLIAALAFALALVIVVDRLDTSFHTVDELRSFTQVPVLASIPKINTKRDLERRRARLGALTLIATATLVLLGAGAFQYAHGSDQIARILLQVG
jgi:polysaccharide chain length determinant protein (PEP-CTERM system associated)